MKVIKYPKIKNWKTLTKRPVISSEKLDSIVSDILINVKQNKDKALLEYSNKFDGVKLSNIAITDEDISTAILKVSENLKKAISLAKTNITKFHSAQRETSEVIETTPGVQCWRKSLPIEKVGLYIPGGTAPLFSTILMLGIPAVLAGCKEIVLCSPPDKNGNIHPAILYTANLIGIKKIFKIGGAQAVAAMAWN
jgi:histidinol dehydrogenase